MDAGNFVYTLWFHIVGYAIELAYNNGETVLRAFQCDVDAGQALLFMRNAENVKNRWPRCTNTWQWCMLYGDMVEMTLGAHYHDERRCPHLQRDIARSILDVEEIVKFIDDRDGARFQQLREIGSFFSTRLSGLYGGPKNTRCYWTTTLAYCIFTAMYVQTKSIDLLSNDGRAFLRLSAQCQLFYPPL